MEIRVIIPLCFMFELLVSESIFLAHIPRKKPFFLRTGIALAAYSILAIGTNDVFLFLPDWIGIRMMFFVIFFAWSMLAICFCFRASLSQIVFIATAGYSVEHIADSFVKIIIAVYNLNALSGRIQVFLLLILPYAVCAGFFYLLFVKRAMLDETMQDDDKRVLGISALNLVICLGLSVVTDHIELSTAAMVCNKIYSSLGCLLCLLLQVGIFQDSKMTQTNKTLQQMMLLERNQHEISKETINLINIKCHDLKHQIELINTQSDEKRRKNVEELSKAVLIYDSIIKTGNEALDMVLMQKKLICENYHIQFSYVVDGAHLNRMDEVDVYSLFGNMLENAIESLRQEPNEEKRVMTLKVSAHMKMLYINMDNYCSTPIVYKDGEIQTTKQNEPGMHGYGIKSIAYIVNAYNGDLMISTQNHHFVIEIMLPEDGIASKRPEES